MTLKAKPSFGKCPAPAAAGNVARLGSATTLSVVTVPETETQLGPSLLTYPSTLVKGVELGETPPNVLFIVENPNRAGGAIHKPQSCRGTSSTTHPNKRRGKCIPHWEFSNKGFPESHSACFPGHTSWQPLVKLAPERRGGRGGLASGSCLEAEKSTHLAAGLSLSRAH